LWYNLGNTKIFKNQIKGGNKMENGNESWFWEHPITKEIQVFSSKEERDKKESEKIFFEIMIEEISK
jgi:hypothetical protein